jgi:nucleotide-binding universal stress UspA family protein
MTKPWTILAPVTMQQTSRRAIEHAIEVANGMSAQLILLHVIPSGTSLSDGDRAMPWPEAALAEDVAGFGLRRMVLCGEPAPTISQYAEEVDADLILMPAARSAWLPTRRSVTSRLLASTPRPVQLWNPSIVADAPPFRCRQLLCVLELDGKDAPLIEATNEIAARTGANVEVLHIVPNATESLLFYSADEPEKPLSSSVAAARLRELLHQLPPALTSSILMGERQRSIALSARRKSADLILVRRKAAAAWPGTGWESTGILKQAGCPIISVPPLAPGQEPESRRLWRSERESVVCGV